MRRAITQVQQNHTDFLAQLEGEPNHCLIVRNEDPLSPYIVDYRRIDEPRTLKTKNRSGLSTFNLYSAIEPRFGPDERNLRHKQTELAKETLEFKAIEFQFRNTIGGAGQVHSILKLENKAIQANFLNELKKNFEKYPDKVPSQLIKLLFHGSKADPKLIYESEEGLDIRRAAFGLAGQGIYFADTAAISNGYVGVQLQVDGQNLKSMFVCFVLPGESAENPQNANQLRQPPNKPNSQELFDSVHMANRQHTVLYTNAKAYPAYLVRYT